MVAFVSYVSVDMRDDSDTEDYFADGTVSVSRTKLTITDGNDKAIYYGSFTLAGSNKISGGTITGIDAILDGKLLGTFRQASIDVVALASVPDSDAAIQNWIETVLFKGADSVTGSKYIDKLYGWAGNDTIKGMEGNDTLIGGSGSDRITGGMGKDRLTGEAGNDIFVLTMSKESGFSTTSRDVITDFTRGQDRLDLSRIDSNTAVAGNNPFKQLLQSDATFTAAGQLKVSGGVLYGNTDADATPEFAVQLMGVSALTLGNFIL